MPKKTNTLTVRALVAKLMQFEGAVPVRFTHGPGRDVALQSVDQQGREVVIDLFQPIDPNVPRGTLKRGRG